MTTASKITLVRVAMIPAYMITMRIPEAQNQILIGNNYTNHQALIFIGNKTVLHDVGCHFFRAKCGIVRSSVVYATFFAEIHNRFRDANDFFHIADRTVQYHIGFRAKVLRQQHEMLQILGKSLVLHPYMNQNVYGKAHLCNAQGCQYALDAEYQSQSKCTCNSINKTLEDGKYVNVLMSFGAQHEIHEIFVYRIEYQSNGGPAKRVQRHTVCFTSHFLINCNQIRSGYKKDQRQHPVDQYVVLHRYLHHFFQGILVLLSIKRTGNQHNCRCYCGLGYAEEISYVVVNTYSRHREAGGQKHNPAVDQKRAQHIAHAIGCLW